MVNLDVFSYLKSEVKKGSDRVSLPVHTICIGTGLTQRSVMTKLKNLQNEGCIEILHTKDKNGATQPNTYVIKSDPEPIQNVNAEMAGLIKVIYCNFVSSRTGQPCNPRYSFSGYMNQFISVAEIVTSGKLNPHMYISACFHTFSEKWCVKTFHTPFPPPYIVASKKNAYERYNGYLRYLNSIEKPIIVESSADEIVENDLYVWRSTGAITDESFIQLLVDNGSITALFAASLPFVSEEFVIYNANMNGLKEKDIKETARILKLKLKG